jgi:hypothetical protein
VPAAGRVGPLLEVFDSKEFTGDFDFKEGRTALNIYKISQKTGNHLRSLGVLHRKKRCVGLHNTFEVRVKNVEARWPGGLRKGVRASCRS